MTKKVAVRSGKSEVKAEDKMFIVSAAVSKKGRRDLYLDGNEETTKRQYSNPQSLTTACSTMSTWEKQPDYYRDIRIHEIGEGKKVKVKTEIVEV